MTSDMNVQWKGLLLTLTLSVMLPLLSGCVAVAVGGAAAGLGAVVYSEGDLETDLDASPARTIAAIHKTIENLKMAKQSEVTEWNETKIKAENYRGKTVTFLARKINNNVTHLSIRVGTLGDESESKRILEEVKKHL